MKDGVYLLAATSENWLTPLDELIYCLWVTGYGMRNAGDLDAARDLYKPFQELMAVRLDRPCAWRFFLRLYVLRHRECSSFCEPAQKQPVDHHANAGPLRLFQKPAEPSRSCFEKNVSL